MTAEQYKGTGSRQEAIEVSAGENTISLKEALGQWTVTELRSLASAYSVKNPSKLRKEPLINKVTSALLERNRMREVLFSLEPADWGLFRRAVAAGTYRPKKSDRECGLTLQRLGYLYRIREEVKETYVVPEEVRAAYLELASGGFCAWKERADLIHAYAMAAINLYGVIPQGDLIRIFNSQNRKKLTEDEMFPVLIRHILLDCGYVLWEEFLVNDAFEDNDFRDVPDLLNRIGDKPRYVPEKAEFLKYADPGYYEPTAATELMEHYLTGDAGLDRAAALEVLDDLHCAIVLENSPIERLNILSDYGMTIPSETLQTVLDILSAMANSTRLWSNNGHTPDEMFEQYEREHLKKLPAKKVKIGRNDPCPCGSGKKYKKCCGR